MEYKKFKVAGYLRLSQEDGDKEVSDSIVSQRTIIENKIKELGEDFELADFYIDDGYTGLNTDRPAFQKMLSDIEKGIYEANLGLTPNNTGEVIFITIPELTEDRRKELVKQVYHVVQKFPSEERYGLADQLRRSVISVPSNVAEGLGRATDKDKGHFMQIAYGSLMEVIAQLDIAHDLNYITSQEFEAIEELLTEETKLLKGMINRFKV